MHFNQLLGIHVVRQHRDGVTIECPIREELMNGAGVVHGGVTATVADAALGIALSRHLKPKRKITTVEMKINYLLPVVEGKLVARASILRTGKRICVGRVDIFDRKKNQVAVALLTYAILSEWTPEEKVRQPQQKRAHGSS